MNTELTSEQYDRVMRVLYENQPVETLQSPEELHQFAWSYNWDDGLEALRRLVNHPLCDKGTALLIYWRAGPGFLYQYVTVDEIPDDYLFKDEYEFVSALEQKYLLNGFASAAIAFDPKKDEGTNWTKEYQETSRNRPIPDEMYQRVTGIQLKRAHF